MLEIVIVDRSNKRFNYQDRNCTLGSGKSSMTKSSKDLVGQYVSERSLNWNSPANISSVSVQFTEGTHTCSVTIYNRGDGFEERSVRNWTDVAVWAGNIAKSSRDTIVSYRSDSGGGL